MNLHGILNKGQGRRFLAAGAVTALGLVLSGAVATTAQADNVGGQMETICHRTGSADGGNQHNGYSVITVSINSIFKTKGHDSHNHIGNGPVGDIIPAFDYGNDQHYDGKNLTGNEDFLKNGCNNGEQPPPPHFSDLTLVKEVVNTGGVQGPGSRQLGAATGVHDLLDQRQIREVWRRRLFTVVAAVLQEVFIAREVLAVVVLVVAVVERRDDVSNRAIANMVVRVMPLRLKDGVDAHGDYRVAVVLVATVGRSRAVADRFHLTSDVVCLSGRCNSAA